MKILCFLLINILCVTLSSHFAWGLCSPSWWTQRFLLHVVCRSGSKSCCFWFLSLLFWNVAAVCPWLCICKISASVHCWETAFSQRAHLDWCVLGGMSGNLVLLTLSVLFWQFIHDASVFTWSFTYFSSQVRISSCILFKCKFNWVTKSSFLQPPCRFKSWHLFLFKSKFTWVWWW